MSIRFCLSSVKPKVLSVGKIVKQALSPLAAFGAGVLLKRFVDDGKKGGRNEDKFEV